MAKKNDLETRLDALACMDLSAPEVLNQLAKALRDKSGFVVAKAAHLVGRGRFHALADALAAAFDRFISDVTDDKGCTAKTALARTLYELGVGEEKLFLTGIHHVQLEQTFGGPVDVAAELRGTCALGLVRVGYRDALTELADLLADKELQARIMAARALAYLGCEEGAAVLRVKILSGDPEPEVIGECVQALVRLTPIKAVAFLDRLLDRGDEALANEAAIALGSCRSPEAYEVLRRRWEADLSPARRRPLLLPLAMSRRPEAMELLMEVIRNASPAMAADAVEALGMYRSDAAIRAAVLQASAGREAAVKEAATKAFPA